MEPLLIWSDSRGLTPRDLLQYPPHRSTRRGLEQRDCPSRGPTSDNISMLSRPGALRSRPIVSPTSSASIAKML